MTAEYAFERLSLRQANLVELAALVSAVFESHGREHGGSVAFTPETFSFLFASPHADPDLFVRAVHVPSGSTVGFLGGIPRRVALGDRVLNLGVPAWLAVHPAHRRRGIAVELGTRLLEIAREKGYDGGLAMFEPEAHGIDTARAVAKRARLHFHELATVRLFVVRALDVARIRRVTSLRLHERVVLRALERAPMPGRRGIRLARDSDGPRLFELAGELRALSDLGLVLGLEDFVWYLRQPSVITVVHEDERGEVDGFVTAWEILLAGFGQREAFGWLDQVCTHRLGRLVAADLARALVVEASRRGWAGLQTPLFPYFDPTPFYLARFVPHPKSLVVTLLSIEDMAIVRPETLYLDWR